MKKLPLILLLATLPALAADPGKTLVKEVTRAAKAKDPEQWRALYCVPHIMGYGEVVSLRDFTKASLGPPPKVQRPGVVAELALCSATPSTGEKCMPIPVGEKDGKMCLK